MYNFSKTLRPTNIIVINLYVKISLEIIVKYTICYKMEINTFEAPSKAAASPINDKFPTNRQTLFG